MKKILVDLYKSKNEYSGLGQFSLQFARYLDEHYAHEFEFHFLVPKNLQEEFSPLIKLKRVSLLLKYWKASHEQYDLWHSLHQLHSYAPPKNFNQLLTIHDLNFQIEKNPEKRIKYKRKLEKEISRANHLTTISSFTKDQLTKTFPKSNTPIKVIHNGVEFLPDQTATRPRVKVGDKFFFSISHFAKKKNFEVLLPMMKYFPDYKLVLAGNHDTKYGSFIKKEITKLGLEEQIVLTGKIPTSEKVYYLKFCNAFLFPSLAEGFGMPPVEAMQFGKPIFISNETSLPEIGGEVAHYFTDFDPNRMATFVKDNLQKQDANPNILAKITRSQAAKFTWEKSMRQYVDLYRDLTQ